MEHQEFTLVPSARYSNLHTWYTTRNIHHVSRDTPAGIAHTLLPSEYACDLSFSFLQSIFFCELFRVTDSSWAISRFMSRDPRQPATTLLEKPKTFFLKLPPRHRLLKVRRRQWIGRVLRVLPVSYPALPWWMRRDFKSRALSQWVRDPSDRPSTYRTKIVNR